MRRLAALVLLDLLFVASSGAQAPAPSPSQSPSTIPISSEQRLQLSLLESQFKAAQTELELARVKVDNAQLRYTLTVVSIRSSLKLDESYSYDERAMAFIKPPDPAPSTAQTKPTPK